METFTTRDEASEARHLLATIMSEDHEVRERMAVRGMSWPPTAADLDAEPTLGVGQADDRKLGGDVVRVWLSRCGEADGEPSDAMVTVEVRTVGGGWAEAGRYCGRYVNGEEHTQYAEVAPSVARYALRNVAPEDRGDLLGW